MQRETSFFMFLKFLSICPDFLYRSPTVFFLFFIIFQNTFKSAGFFFFGRHYLSSPPHPPGESQRIPARRPARPLSRCLFTLPEGDRRCLRLMLTRSGAQSGGEVKRDVMKLFRGNRRQRAKKPEDALMTTSG